MNNQDFRKLLEQADDKLSIFSSAEELNKYELNAKELLDLISSYLSDEEKLKLFDYSHFRQLENYIKCVILKLVSDENIILQMLNNDNIVDGLASFQIIDIIKKTSDDIKKHILYNQEFIEKYRISYYELKIIVLSLTDEARTEILMDINLITNTLHLRNFQVAELAEDLLSEDAKSRIIEIYKLENYLKINIINTFQNKSKLDILLKDYSFSKYDKIRILKSLDIETLKKFFLEHKEFFSENDIHPYNIILGLNSNQQKEFIADLDNINLTLSEKKEILATLKEDIKQNIDTTNFPAEYKLALSIEITENSRKNHFRFRKKFRRLSRTRQFNDNKP